MADQFQLSEPRPATVSDVVWIEETTGRCEDCGRDGVPLGRVNLAHPSARRLACFDCHFGPPPEMFFAGGALWDFQGDPEDHP